jgi:hypothetical protein
MIVQIDGEEVKVLNDIKVIWEDSPDTDQQLHMAATCEGIILDVLDKDGEVEATMSLDTEQLSEECI